MKSAVAFFGAQSIAGVFRLASAAFSLCAVVVFAASVSSCGSYDPLPPKTEASTSYYIPAPEAPTQTEIDEMKAERAEYNELTR